MTAVSGKLLPLQSRTPPGHIANVPVFNLLCHSMCASVCQCCCSLAVPIGHGRPSQRRSLTLPESVLSLISSFNSWTGSTGDERLGSAGAGNCTTDLSTAIAELLTRTRRATRLKPCNLKFDSLTGLHVMKSWDQQGKATARQICRQALLNCGRGPDGLPDV
jgi:hypothetical protein